jgi:hypothetical protein
VRHTPTSKAPASGGSLAEAVLERLNEILAVCKRLVEMLDEDVIPVRRNWLTPVEAASYLSVHPMWLAKLRSQRAGPRFYSRGRVVRYHVNDLDAFLRGETFQRVAANGER